MNKRDPWEVFSGYGGVLIFQAVFILTFAFIYCSNPPTPGFREEAQHIPNKPNSYEEHAKPSSDLRPDAAIPKKPNIAEYAADENGAQRTNTTESGFWVDPNLRTAQFTLGLLIVGVVQFFLFRWQLGIMKTTIEQANRTEAIARKQLRAYVVLEIGKDFIAPNRPDVVRICYTNCGQTPALNVRSYIEWKWFDGKDVFWDEEIPFDSECTGIGSQFPVGSGAHHTGDVLITSLKDHENFIPFLALEGRHQKTVYYYGSIEYSDVFGDPHRTNFCFRHHAGHGINAYYVHSAHNSCE